MLSNIVPQLILLFRGEERFVNPDQDDNSEDEDIGGLDAKDTFVLDAATWETIGREMENSRMTVPTQPFGRPPRDINTKHDTFKAAEWSSWLLYYSTPLLQGKLPGKYMDNWKDLVKIWGFICSKDITKEQIEECRELCIQYVINYERLYFRGRWERLRLLKSNLHAILHVADALTDLGPGPGWWGFPAERFNSTL